MMGDEKPMAEAVASGTNPIPLTESAVEPSSRNERVICITGRFARNIRQPWLGMNTRIIVRRWPVNRAQTISITE